MHLIKHSGFPLAPQALGRLGDNIQLFLHLIQLGRQSRRCRTQPPLGPAGQMCWVHQCVSIQSKAEAGQSKPAIT